MRVLVCGDRDYKERWAVFDELQTVLEANGNIVVIEGGAKGADLFAREWCESYRGKPESLAIEHITFVAEWKRYRNGAGPRRNQQMLDIGEPDLVIAFHNDIEHSKGTADMVRRAEAAGVPVRLVEAAGGE